MTKASLFAGVEQMRPGNHLGDVSAAIQRTVEAEGLSIIRTLVGHGIGREMHEEPQVPNFGEPGKGPELEEGMVLAIEPMVNVGGPLVRMGDDGWSVYSEDGSLAAHFEFTVAVTPEGPRILTPWHEAGLARAGRPGRSAPLAVGAPQPGKEKFLCIVRSCPRRALALLIALRRARRRRVAAASAAPRPTGPTTRAASATSCPRARTALANFGADPRLPRPRRCCRRTSPTSSRSTKTCVYGAPDADRGPDPELLQGRDLRRARPAKSNRRSNRAPG